MKIAISYGREYSEITKYKITAVVEGIIFGSTDEPRPSWVRQQNDGYILFRFDEPVVLFINNKDHAFVYKPDSEFIPEIKTNETLITV